MENLNARRCQWIADHVLPWEDEVRRWCGRYSRTLDSADIDDLIQEAYARLWATDLSHIRDGRQFFYAVVHNKLQDQLRRARIVQIDHVAELDALILDEAPGPERWLSACQEYDRLLEVLKTLTPRRRRAYQLRKFDNLPLKEIGRRLGVSEKTVQNLLRLAQAHVMKAMFAQGKITLPSATSGRGKAGGVLRARAHGRSQAQPTAHAEGWCLSPC